MKEEEKFQTKLKLLKHNGKSETNKQTKNIRFDSIQEKKTSCNIRNDYERRKEEKFSLNHIIRNAFSCLQRIKPELSGIFGLPGIFGLCGYVSGQKVTLPKRTEMRCNSISMLVT